MEVTGGWGGYLITADEEDGRSRGVQKVGLHCRTVDEYYRYACVMQTHSRNYLINT